MFDRLAMVVLDSILVANDLPVELVDQRVDRRVHVVLKRLDVDVVAAHPQCDFGALAHPFYRQLHARIDDLIKVALDSRQLAGYVGTQCRRNFQVVSVDREVHRVGPFNR